jgi:hypothetical protein
MIEISEKKENIEKNGEKKRVPEHRLVDTFATPFFGFSKDVVIFMFICLWALFFHYGFMLFVLFIGAIFVIYRALVNIDIIVYDDSVCFVRSIFKIKKNYPFSIIKHIKPIAHINETKHTMIGIKYKTTRTRNYLDLQLLLKKGKTKNYNLFRVTKEDNKQDNIAETIILAFQNYKLLY